MLKTLGTQVKEYKFSSILTPLCMLGEVGMEMVIPMLVASMIDSGIEKGDLHHVFVVGGWMVAAAMCSLLFGVLGGRFAAHASTGFAKNLRQSMFENIQTFSFSNIDKYSTAGLVTRLTTDVTNLQNAYQMILRMCVRAPATMIVAMVMAFSINRSISLVFLAAVLFLALVLGLLVSRTFKLFEQVFRKYDDLNASVQENVAGIRVVKAYVREEYEDQKFRRAAQNIYKMFVKAESLLALNQPIMSATVSACILLLSWMGARMIIGGTMTTGNLTSLFSYMMNILMSLMMLSMIFVMVAMSKASAERICQVLEEKSDLTSPPDGATQVENGAVVFENVSFSYKADSGKKVLRDVNLTIQPGEMIGIIGGTGSAKTSLVQLIPRLYDTTEGRVLVGGRDVREYDLDTLRGAVAMVLQKNTLFSGTIKENLRWGDANATDQEIVRACQQACADEFIQQMPDGYDTYIEQGGSNVSGGQKQRLCIARALLKKPKVLILDDSTSAVDTATDASIRQAFAEQIPNTTKIIIAQRISSIENADKIIVLDEGVVTAFGSHSELMAQSEIYRDIYTSQTKGGQQDA